MKNVFKKISAIAASALMVGMTMGVAAAANYPAPFVSGGVADVAVVYGTGTGVNPSDQVQAGYIQTDLAGSVVVSGGTPSGDSVLLAKSTDNLNLQDTWSVFTGTIDYEELSTLLATGTYLAGDNDEFDYEQKIALGTPQLTHFRDSDYEDLVGLSEKTPTVGFKISSNTYILNYTLEFLDDVTSDLVSSRMDDIEGSDIPLLGKNYYVSEFHNGSASTGSSFNKAILLDSADSGNVAEGQTATVSGKSVSIDWMDNDEVVFMVDGELAPANGKLQKGNSYKLKDGSYIGVKSIKKLEVSGEVGSVSFSIGSGKLEITHGSEIKLNDDAISGVKGYLWKSSNNLDKITIQWTTDDEVFVSPNSEITIPGFEAVKFTMGSLVRNEEEKVTIAKDGDTSFQLSMPLKDGTVNFNILYSNSSGEFIGIGKATDEKLATTNYSDFTFYEKRGGNDWHSYFIATYNVSKEGQSYLLRAKVSEDASAGRNETAIEKYDGGSSKWVGVCSEKKAGDDCNIGDVTLNIGTINYSSGGDESVNISAATNVNFHTAITPGGLVVYLPFDNNETRWAGGNEPVGNGSVGMPGAVSFNVSDVVLGHGHDTFLLFFDGEDKDETLGAGTGFSFLLDDSSDKVQVSQVNTTGGSTATTGSGGENGLEVGSSTGIYEAYVRDDVAPRILHYTKSDNDDWAEVYYPSGDSETYAEVYLTEKSSVMEGAGDSGVVLVKDSEVSSVSTKYLVVVGGSCINSAAATLVGGAKCEADWTTATGVGAGQFLIQSFGDAYTTGKVALLVAGYAAADTINAVTYLRTNTVDTTAGKKYKSTSSTTAELVVS